MVAIIMPDDVAEEKVKALRALGADVERVRPASIVDKKQVRTHTLFDIDLVTYSLPTCSML
jgi:cysteine synthase